jgi:hypothetical protein
MSETKLMTGQLLAVSHQPLPRAVSTRAFILKTHFDRSWVKKRTTTAGVIHGNGWKDLAMVSGGAFLINVSQRGF